MSHRNLAPDAFAVGMLAFGVVLLLFPLMRVPGVIALLAALGYWLTIAVLRARRR